MNNEDLLNRYFSNSLSKAEELQLQQLLQTDAEFKKQFEFESNLKHVAKAKRHQDLKSKLNQFETEMKSVNKSDEFESHTKVIPLKSSYFYMKIAASIAVLLTVGWFGYQSFFALDYNDLYTENYSAYPNTVVIIKRSDTINSIERDAFAAYENEDYKLALKKFNSAETKDYFDFYKAQSYLNLNEDENAKALFDKVIDKNQQFVAESHWYLALINIKEKNKEKAVSHLKLLVANYNYKKTEAKDLLKKLE